MEIWMDVDSALSEVPVNIMPLLDDTDFKSREESIAYNATGLELIWHFVTTAGATSATVVTPTTGGNYDWAHQDGGMYTIEIPASGGASINNDTEGFGWFTGVATGVLPWRGPIIGFRAAGLNNALINSAYSTTRGLAGTALPDAAADAAGGLPISDAGGLDLDAQIGTDIDAILTDTGTTLQGELDGIQADTEDIQSRLPAALVTGRIDASVGAVAANAITAASIATDAIDADALAADAVAEIADGVWDEVMSGHSGSTTAGGVVAAILVDTSFIGTAGAGLSAIPWNSDWDAQAQSEAADALNAYDPPTNAEMVAAFTEIKGATWSALTDTIEHIRDKETDIETDTQDLQTQVGTDGAGLTNLPWNAAWDTEVQSEATDALNAYDPPTNAEMEARTLVAASYFDPAADTVAHVTLVDTTTTNTDMVAEPPTADVTAIKAVMDKLDTTLVVDGAVYDFTAAALAAAPSGSGATAEEVRIEMDANSTQLAAIVADTNELQTDWANGGRLDTILDAAGSAGDPWITELPGSYTSGQAGYILGTDIDSASGIATTVWANTTRTLTQSAASVTSAVSGSTITQYRGTRWSMTITISDSTGYSKLWFTVKRSQDDADTAALVMVEAASGLLYINGAAATTAANASITVNSGTSITVMVKGVETAKLAPSTGLYYDVKALINSDGPDILGEGSFIIDADTTRATS